MARLRRIVKDEKERSGVRRGTCGAETWKGIMDRELFSMIKRERFLVYLCRKYRLQYFRNINKVYQQKRVGETDFILLWRKDEIQCGGCEEKVKIQ